MGRARFPIRGYYFPDDPISTPANVPSMLSLYDRVEIEPRWVARSDLNVSTVGHLGFFRSDVGRPLWDEALEWLAQQA
jgi:predicted alpha/beta hydrolase